MVKKIISVIIGAILPKSYIQNFLQNCSQIKFETKLTPRPQFHTQMFYPFYYKDIFVRDCIFELKDRNSRDVASLFGEILSRWIMRKIEEVLLQNPVSFRIYSGISSNNNEIPGQARDDKIKFYLVPVPQHTSKTKEKGFCHTTTLVQEIDIILKKRHLNIHIRFFPCIGKIKKTKKLHDTQGKRRRFNIIKGTMRSYLTKHDAKHAYFFIIDDVYTTGATFKEIRRSLSDCAVPHEHVFFVSIAH